jgi:hypothetical protein
MLVYEIENGLDCFADFIGPIWVEQNPLACNPTELADSFNCSVVPMMRTGHLTALNLFVAVFKQVLVISPYINQLALRSHYADEFEHLIGFVTSIESVSTENDYVFWVILIETCLI